MEPGRYPLIIQKGRGNNTGGLRALDGKTPSMTSCAWEHNNHLTNGVDYRKLTPVEVSDCKHSQIISQPTSATRSDTRHLVTLDG